MSKKSVSFKPRPASADEWVQSAPAPEQAPKGPAEPMKRFTIDVPESLHTQIRVECSKRKAKMADVLRDILEREFPPNVKS